MDHENLPRIDEQIKNRVSSTDLSSVMEVCKTFAESNYKGKTKQKSIELYQKCLEMARVLKDKRNELIICSRLGLLYGEISKFNEAIEYQLECLRISKEIKHLEGEKSALCNLGIIHHSIGQYEKAIQYHMDDLRMSRETGDLEGQGKAHVNIGISYHTFGKYQMAIENYMEKVRISNETGDIEGKGKACCNLGLAYWALGQYKKAIKYEEAFLDVSGKTSDLPGMGLAACNLGILYRSLGQNNTAIEYTMKFLRISKETGNLVGEGKAYTNLGCAYYSLGEYTKAIEYHLKDLEVSKTIGDVAGEGRAYSNIGAAFDLLGQYERAIEYYMQSIPISMSTGNIQAQAYRYHNVGFAYFHLGELSKAEQNLKISISCFEEVFRSIKQQDKMKISVVDTYIQTYHLLTDVLIDAKKTEDALLVSERGRAQALRDQLIIKYQLSMEKIGEQLQQEDLDTVVGGNRFPVLFFANSYQRNAMQVFMVKPNKEISFKSTSYDVLAELGHCDRSPKVLQKTLERYIDKLIQAANSHVDNMREYSCEDRSVIPSQSQINEDEHSLEGKSLPEGNMGNERAMKEEPRINNDPVSQNEGEPAEYSDEHTETSYKPHQQSEGHSQQSSYSMCATTLFDGKQTKEHSSVQSGDSESVMYGGTKKPDAANSQTDSVLKERRNTENYFEELYELLIAPVREELTDTVIVIPEGPLFWVPFAALKDITTLSRFLVN